ncbi:hypothetical protein F4861DRAFT_107091 [Xylaria intraflava]|nr:hypothetical protein F4861DRAFT_107091 [Xylaria intraflava]
MCRHCPILSLVGAVALCPLASAGKAKMISGGPRARDALHFSICKDVGCILENRRCFCLQKTVYRNLCRGSETPAWWDGDCAAATETYKNVAGNTTCLSD